MILTETDIDVPSSWERLDPAGLTGTVLVLGGTDTGKSTLVRWLVEEQRRAGRRVGWVDADPGQNALGVPGTLGLALAGASPAEPEVQATWFVGSTSPRGHMLPVLAGVRRLRDAALARGCETVLIDTSGMISPESGGGALKQWKIELLRPERVIGVSREGELDHLLEPLRLDRRTELHELAPSERVRQRTPAVRALRRRRRYRDYFQGGKSLRFRLGRFPVYGLGGTLEGRLAAFLDREGMVLGLGTVTSFGDGLFRMFAKNVDLAETAAFRVGALAVDPYTGEDGWP